ncbi:MAG TPA: outer membrane protein assembly factor BamE [Gemmataceae bacterium]|jgi:outer membrane protein assembly factor BamE (lipoprotein component of BamABCDE complex)|nr:outer membrane protein assembly factor BamE [Gemmataceae bacterium]
MFLAEYTPDEEVQVLPPRTRDEVRQQVAGRTREEVRGVLGRPIAEDGPNRHWDYRNMSRDPATGRTDPMLHVHFGPDERVFEVEFDPPEQLPPRPADE